MMTNGFRRSRNAFNRFVAAASLINPRRVVRFLKSLSRRLDDIMRLVQAECASRLERDTQLTHQWQHALHEFERPLREFERQLSDMSDRLHHAIGSGIDQLSKGQSSQLDGLHSRFIELTNSVNALHVDQAKIHEYEAFLRYCRRREYDRAIEEGRLAVPLLETEFPVAFSSPHTRRNRHRTIDDSILHAFNRKLNESFGGQGELRVLDLGCGAGAYVRALLDDGHFAVGLEGGDDLLAHQAREWWTIPKHLFTCDITRPFQLTDRTTKAPLRFDAVTAWGVLEHVHQEQLAGLFGNIDRHLDSGGAVLLSIGTAVDWDPRSGSVWNTTVKPRTWWEDRFAAFGFVIAKNLAFGSGDWLGDSGSGPVDRNVAGELTFYIALRRSASSIAPALQNPGSRALVA